MAFRVTGRVMAGLQRERNDVQIALRKTWKAYEHTDGLVTRSISPHQVNLLGSFFKGLPKKLKYRWVEHGPEIILALTLGLGVTSYAADGFEKSHFVHRD